jgi:hypothetical protein
MRRSSAWSGEMPASGLGTGAPGNVIALPTSASSAVRMVRHAWAPATLCSAVAPSATAPRIASIISSIWVSSQGGCGRGTYLLLTTHPDLRRPGCVSCRHARPGGSIW